MAQGAIGNDNDDLLLLTLGINTDEDDFSKARNQIKLLQDSMKDTENTFNLGGFVSGLNKAVQALKIAVNAWNALEDHAISVASNRNYMPFGVSAGEMESIMTKVGASKTAKSVGLTPSSVRSSLTAIENEQYKVKLQGQNPTEQTWIAITQLAKQLGDQRFQGGNLKTTLLDYTTKDVYVALTDMLANASRWVYAVPEGQERQRRLTYWKNAQSSPYFTEGEANYIALQTKKENPTWGKAGNPIVPLISGTPEDLGAYNAKVETASSKTLNVADALNYLKAEISEVGNLASTTVYNALGDNVVIPVLRNVNRFTDALSGKGMKEQQRFEGYGTFEYALPFGKAAQSEAQSFRKKYASSLMLDATGTYYVGDWSERAGKAKSYYTNTNNAILGELGLYELAKMSSINYSAQAFNAIQWAKTNLQENLKMSDKDAEALLSDPNSVYAKAFQSGGFTGLASVLYKNNALTEKQYMQFMADIINETKHKEITKYYSDVKTDDEVTAATKIKSEGGVKRTVIELQITAPNGEKTTQEITPEELASLQLRL